MSINLFMHDLIWHQLAIVLISNRTCNWDVCLFIIMRDNIIARLMRILYKHILIIYTCRICEFCMFLKFLNFYVRCFTKSVCLR